MKSKKTLGSGFLFLLIAGVVGYGIGLGLDLLVTGRIDELLLALGSHFDAMTSSLEIVAKGAPLGLMPYHQSTNDAELSGAIVIDAGAARTETLYMEIRKDQMPVDPAFWFVGEKD